MILKDVKLYLKKYDTETYIFSDIGPAVKNKGYMTFEDFFLVCMWKTARAKKHYLKNIETVTSITKEAFKLTDDKSKIIKLCELKGVSVPVASAILTVIYPKSYGVIDIRCLQMLNQLGYTFSYITMPNNYIKYLHTIREIAKENNITPREVDKILFAMHREELMKKQYKNLYK